MKMYPSTARTLWKSLMDNASVLIADAQALLERESFGRTRSLTVLAQEELRKTLWIYEAFEYSWSTGVDEAREVSWAHLTRSFPRREVHGCVHLQSGVRIVLGRLWQHPAHATPPWFHAPISAIIRQLARPVRCIARIL